MSNIINVIWGNEGLYRHGSHILENIFKREIGYYFVMEPGLVCKGVSSSSLNTGLNKLRLRML